MGTEQKPLDEIHIGVISDTHGFLPEGAIETLEGSDLILHAGDVGKQAILFQLEQVAPVVAVRGNMDHGAWSQALPMNKVLEVGGLTIFMLHDLSTITVDPRAERYAVVISGHTHQAHLKEVKGVIFLNPGTAGVKRSGKPLSVARVVVTGGRAESEIIQFDG